MSDIPKYNDNNYRHPGDFRAKDILLYSYGGSILDISNVTAVINLYQGLDTPFQSGNILSLTQWLRLHPISFILMAQLKQN